MCYICTVYIYIYITNIYIYIYMYMYYIQLNLDFRRSRPSFFLASPRDGQIYNCWIWTWGEAVHTMTTNRLFGRSQGLWCWLWFLSCTPELRIIIIIVHARDYNYDCCCQHFLKQIFVNISCQHFWKLWLLTFIASTSENYK